jgi:hypothetical protein
VAPFRSAVFLGPFVSNDPEVAMFPRHHLVRTVAGLGALSLASVALAGPDWIEVGDAGSTVTTAQVPLNISGVTFLRSISGGLASGVGVPDYEDLYVIRVTDAVNFSITTGTADFNPILYLFNITVNSEGLGLLANDDQSAANDLPRMVAQSTDGTGVQVSQPGDYVLAVTGFGRAPVSRTGNMFNFASLTEISGPDGVGGLNPLSGWTGEGEVGDYRLDFEFIDYPVFPAPGTGAAIVFGGLLMARRRR